MKTRKKKTVVYHASCNMTGIEKIVTDYTVPFEELPDVVTVVSINESWKWTRNLPKEWLHPTYEAALKEYVDLQLKAIEDATRALRDIQYQEALP